MKFKITKSAFDKLSDDLKLEYKADGDDYVLQIEGQPREEGTAALRNALDRERAENADLKRDNKELGTKLATAEQKAEGGDAELRRENARLTRKLESTEKETTDKLAAKDRVIIDGARDRTVNALAAKISTSPGVIAPHIASRLDVTLDPDTNEAKIAIKGKDGKIDAALTIDKLGEEFVANPDFRGIIRASGASGTRPPASAGGAPPAPGNGNHQQQQNNQPVDLTKADNRAFIDHVKAVHQARAERTGQ